MTGTRHKACIMCTHTSQPAQNTGIMVYGTRLNYDASLAVTAVLNSCLHGILLTVIEMML